MKVTTKGAGRCGRTRHRESVRGQRRRPLWGAVASALFLLATAPAWGATVGVVNINTASAAELELLPGVGAQRAAAIIARRQARGGFKRAEDLTDVEGIGAVMLERMRPHVALEGATSARRVASRAGADESGR